MHGKTQLLIDSSCWIEFFRGSRIGQKVSTHLASNSNMTLNVVLAEVVCVLLAPPKESRSGPKARSAPPMVPLSGGQVDLVVARIGLLSTVDGFTAQEAVLAGKIRAELTARKRNAAYADCIQMAVARLRGAKVLSKDAIFDGIPEGIYLGGSQ